VVPFLQRANLVSDPPPCDLAPYLAKIVEAAGDRIKTAGDILEYRDFFTPDDQLAYDEKAFDKRIRGAAEATGLLTKVRERLAVIEPFSAANLEAMVHDLVKSENIQIGNLIHPMRLAMTGKSVGFGLFETLEILGRERCLGRIERGLARAR
jgi:glutamyl-tRNA synthetase